MSDAKPYPSDNTDEVAISGELPNIDPTIYITYNTMPDTNTVIIFLLSIAAANTIDVHKNTEGTINSK